MRLQKYMAMCGVASRRKSEEIIQEGRVKVNNRIVTELGTIVDPKTDKISVDGKMIKLESNKIYIMINKPIGYVSSLKDEKGRRTVTDLIEGVNERIYPVGRLDADTTGLLLLTNDGDLAYKLTHPRNNIDKKYIAIVDGIPNKSALDSLRKGVYIDGKKTSPAKVKIAKKYDEDSILDIIIHEGRNRQVKKMCEAVGHPVKKLKRVSIGEIEIGGLNVGYWRFLNDEELEYLKSL